jgi:hypothetical protein
MSIQVKNGGICQHDHKGFTIEPAIMGLGCLIAIHGRKMILYYTAAKPNFTTEKRKLAKIYSSAVRAHDAVDKIFEIHSKWVSKQMKNVSGDAFVSK